MAGSNSMHISILLIMLVFLSNPEVLIASTYRGVISIQIHEVNSDKNFMQITYHDVKYQVKRPNNERLRHDNGSRTNRR